MLDKSGLRGSSLTAYVRPCLIPLVINYLGSKCEYQFEAAAAGFLNAVTEASSASQLPLGRPEFSVVVEEKEEEGPLVGMENEGAAAAAATVVTSYLPG